MAETIITPIVFLASLGRTIDIMQYNMPNLPSIFDKSEVVETPVNVLNSTYHVLQDGEIPYSRFGVPIDLVIQRNRDDYGTILRNFKAMIPESFDSVPVLFVSEYRTIDQTVKDNAKPTPGWQVRNRKSHTHYVNAMHYGGRCYVLTHFSSNVTGDIQVIRRILADVMGTSGSIGSDTKLLWRKAKKAIMESEDVRGEVSISTVFTVTEAAKMPDFKDIEDLLENMNEFSKYVIPPNPQRTNAPLYVTLRPLHDLDDQYGVIEKNVLAEKNLLKLQQMYNDVEYTYGKLEVLDAILPEEEFNDYYRKLKSVRKSLLKLYNSSPSIYKNIDTGAFMSAFGIYQNGLDNSTENYFAVHKRLYEKADIKCQNNFLKPARGSLIVNENEVVKKGRIASLTKCQDLCVEDKKCRAVGYSEHEKECLIYYRSTNSARIPFPKSSTDFKIYDRRCK